MKIVTINEEKLMEQFSQMTAHDLMDLFFSVDLFHIQPAPLSFGYWVNGEAYGNEVTKVIANLVDGIYFDEEGEMQTDGSLYWDTYLLPQALFHLYNGDIRQYNRERRNWLTQLPEMLENKQSEKLFNACKDMRTPPNKEKRMKLFRAYQKTHLNKTREDIENYSK